LVINRKSTKLMFLNLTRNIPAKHIIQSKPELIYSARHPFSLNLFILTLVLISYHRNRIIYVKLMRKIFNYS
jgi:hypothetical protein